MQEVIKASDLDFVIVYGSAARYLLGAGPAPRDIDLAIGGRVSHEDARRALIRYLDGVIDGWGRAQEILGRINTGDLPLDIRRYYVDWTGTVLLPTPFGVTCLWQRIEADPRLNVKIVENREMPAIIRAGALLGWSGPKLGGKIAALLSSRDEMSGCWREFNLALLPDTEDSRAYTTEGVRALRSARRHVSDEVWVGMVSALGDFGALLDALMTRSISADFESKFRPYFPGSAPGAVLCIDWAKQELFPAYGPEHRWAFREILTHLV